MHGYFTLPGLVDRPYIYTVTHISEGRSYCTRSIAVRQPVSPVSLLPDGRFNPEDVGKPNGKICFTSICSFKRDEPSTTGHQAKIDLGKTYDSVLHGKQPHDHLLHPRLDAPWYHRYREIFGQVNDFPGLELRKVDMSAFNKGKEAINHRQLSYYRTIGSIPSTQLNMSACAHLYASDRNSLYLISNAVGFGDEVNVMGSLSHSVVFHASSKDLALKEGEWWCQESWTSRSGGGRGMVESRILDSNGLHVASTWQDGLVRKAARESDQKQKLTWLRMLEDDSRSAKEIPKPGLHKL